MITLHLGIYEGEVQRITFNSKKDLLDYLHDIKKSNFECIWLCSGEGDIGYDEILITESIDTVELAINGLVFSLFEDELENKNFDLHLHEYQTYEDAYKVALDMREPNPKCYNR